MTTATNHIVEKPAELWTSAVESVFFVRIYSRSCIFRERAKISENRRQNIPEKHQKHTKKAIHL